jgi:hypothetical protein
MKKKTTMRKSKLPETVVMGVGWYRPEQWKRLRQISADVNKLEKTHAEWLAIAEKTVKDLTRQGVSILKVDVDVEELRIWCGKQGLPIDAEARAKFVSHRIPKMVEHKKS